MLLVAITIETVTTVVVSVVVDVRLRVGLLYLLETEAVIELSEITEGPVAEEYMGETAGRVAHEPLVITGVDDISVSVVDPTIGMLKFVAVG